MRDILYLVVHCTATPHDTTVASIKRHWKEVLGWKSVGYHKIIQANGNIETLAKDEQITNGVAGYNKNCLHVAYIGGEHTDDRTIGQRQAIAGVLLHWMKLYPKATIKGHRDFPKVYKDCPQFNVGKEYGYLYELVE